MGNSHSAEDKNSSISGGGKVRRKSKVFGRFGGKKAKDTSGTSDRGEGHSEGGESKSADHSTASFEQLVEGSTDLDSAREALSIDVASRGINFYKTNKGCFAASELDPVLATPTEHFVIVKEQPSAVCHITSGQSPIFPALASLHQLKREQEGNCLFKEPPACKGTVTSRNPLPSGRPPIELYLQCDEKNPKVMRNTALSINAPQQLPNNAI